MRIEFTTNTRGYSIELERDLFDDVVLRRNWYSLLTKRRGGKQQVFSSELQAMNVVQAVERTRLRRGYHRVDCL